MITHANLMCLANIYWMMNWLNSEWMDEQSMAEETIYCSDLESLSVLLDAWFASNKPSAIQVSR